MRRAPIPMGTRPPPSRRLVLRVLGSSLVVRVLAVGPVVSVALGESEVLGEPVRVVGVRVFDWWVVWAVSCSHGLQSAKVYANNQYMFYSY